jgi:hypothetical protein
VLARRDPRARPDEREACRSTVPRFQRAKKWTLPLSAQLLRRRGSSSRGGRSRSVNGTGRTLRHTGGAGVLARGKQRAPLDTVRVTPRRNEARIAPHQGRLPLHVCVSQPNASLDMAQLLVEAESGSVPCDQQGRGSGSLQVRNLQGRTSLAGGGDGSRSIAGSGPAPRRCVCPVSLQATEASMCSRGKGTHRVGDRIAAQESVLLHCP